MLELFICPVCKQVKVVRTEKSSEDVLIDGAIAPVCIDCHRRLVRQSRELNEKRQPLREGGPL